MKHEMQDCNNSNGKLFLGDRSRIWVYDDGSREVLITAWAITKKGVPITEIFIDGKVILELIDKKFNEEFYEPKDMEKTTAEIRHLCDSVLIIDTISDFADFTRVPNELYDCVEKLLTEMKNVKEIHAYCGNGIFLGMKRNAFGKIIKLNAIPPRSNKFPGTRFDSTV